MAIKAISLNPISFKSKFDDDTNPTIWKIRGLTRLEWMELENNMQTSSITLDGDKVKQINNQSNTGTVSKLLIDCGLVGWENFVDAEGKVIAFTEAGKDQIPRDIRDEIASEISKLTSIDSTQTKN